MVGHGADLFTQFDFSEAWDLGEPISLFSIVDQNNSIELPFSHIL